MADRIEFAERFDALELHLPFDRRGGNHSEQLPDRVAARRTVEEDLPAGGEMLLRRGKHRRRDIEDGGHHQHPIPEFDAGFDRLHEVRT